MGTPKSILVTPHSGRKKSKNYWNELETMKRLGYIDSPDESDKKEKVKKDLSRPDPFKLGQDD